MINCNSKIARKKDPSEFKKNEKMLNILSYIKNIDLDQIKTLVHYDKEKEDFSFDNGLNLRFSSHFYQ